MFRNENTGLKYAVNITKSHLFQVFKSCQLGLDIMPDFALRARKVIGNYISQNVTLGVMENIHQEFVGESRDFNRWEQVQKEYANQDWNATTFEEFLRITKERVEGDIEEISQAYIDILGPDNLTTKAITESLDAHPVSEEGGQREGFQYRYSEDNESISASYYYYTSSVDITEDLEIEELPSQKRIPFEIHLRRRLIIVKTTMPSRVGKLKKTIDDETIMDVDTTGNLNLVEEQADQIVQSFIHEFDQEGNNVE